MIVAWRRQGLSKIDSHIHTHTHTPYFNILYLTSLYYLCRLRSNIYWITNVPIWVGLTQYLKSNWQFKLLNCIFFDAGKLNQIVSEMLQDKYLQNWMASNCFKTWKKVFWVFFYFIQDTEISKECDKWWGSSRSHNAPIEYPC